MSLIYQGSDFQGQIRSRFQKLAEAELANRNISMDREAAQRFAKLVENGAILFSQNAEDDILSHGQNRAQVWDSEFKSTEAKLTQIIYQMAHQAQKAGKSEIDSETFQRVIQIVCPLWPFC